MILRFETFDRITLRGRRYFFRIVAVGNSEPVAQSEGYRNRFDRDSTIGLIKRGAAIAETRESRR